MKDKLHLIVGQLVTVAVGTGPGSVKFLLSGDLSVGNKTGRYAVAGFGNGCTFCADDVSSIERFDSGGIIIHIGS